MTFAIGWGRIVLAAMQCPNCNAQARDDAAFCRDCGATLSAASCASCGGQLSAGAQFCRQCGTAVSARATEAGTPEAATAIATGGSSSTAPWRDPRLIGVAAVAVLVLGVAVVGALVLLGGSGGGDDAADGVEVPQIEFADVEISDAARAELQAALEALPEIAGATEAEQLRNFFGVPDLFELSFETDGEGRVRRLETWYYLDIGIAYELLDQEVLVTFPIEEPEGLLAVSLRFDPLEFQPQTTIEEIRAMLADPASLIDQPAPEGYELDITFWAGEALVVALDSEAAIIFVESFPLSLDGVLE